MDDLGKLAAQNGIGLALLVWFLVKMQPAMDALTKAVNRQSTIFLVLIDRLQYQCPFLRDATANEQEEQLRRMKAEIEKEQGR